MRMKLFIPGRLDAERRVDQLVTAFDQVHHKITDATLVIYGYGGELDRLKQQVSPVALRDRRDFCWVSTELNNGL
jgi:poly(glycerol-phosphate) alpha-glucosyltransferase